MENNELEDNEETADDNESRSGGATDYVKGTIVTNVHLCPAFCMIVQLQLQLQSCVCS